jgi:hypothetical protein
LSSTRPRHLRPRSLRASRNPAQVCPTLHLHRPRFVPAHCLLCPSSRFRRPLCPSFHSRHPLFASTHRPPRADYVSLLVYELGDAIRKHEPASNNNTGAKPARLPPREPAPSLRTLGALCVSAVSFLCIAVAQAKACVSASRLRCGHRLKPVLHVLAELREEERFLTARTCLRQAGSARNDGER